MERPVKFKYDSCIRYESKTTMGTTNVQLIGRVAKRTTVGDQAHVPHVKPN